MEFIILIPILLGILFLLRKKFRKNSQEQIEGYPYKNPTPESRTNFYRVLELNETFKGKKVQLRLFNKLEDYEFLNADMFAHTVYLNDKNNKEIYLTIEAFEQSYEKISDNTNI